MISLFQWQKGQTVPVTTAVRNKNAAASSAHAPCAIARLSCDPCFYDSSTAVPRFNLNRLLSCENDWSSYSGTHKVGNKKSSAFRFPPCVAYCADGSSRHGQVQTFQPPCHSRGTFSHQR